MVESFKCCLLKVLAGCYADLGLTNAYFINWITLCSVAENVFTSQPSSKERVENGLQNVKQNMKFVLI